MKTGEKFIERFNILALERLKQAGFSIFIKKVDSLPSYSTEISLKNKSQEYLIWFSDNRLDYDSGVLISQIEVNKNRWESIVFPKDRESQKFLSFYPEQSDKSIKIICDFLISRINQIA